jgi:methylglutaconyl-CoA hydratase
MTTPVLTEQSGAVCTVKINRPQAHNALSVEVVAGLIDALAGAGVDDSVRVVVLTGAGDKTFCAGADLKHAHSDSGASSAFDASDEDNPLVRLFRAMRDCPKPIVGRINGSAYGGGLGLVSACDLAYAASHARFGTPEVKLGLFPMMITTYLIRQLPRRRFWEMAFLGEPVTAAQAEAWHLINQAVPADQLDALVEQVARKLCDCSPHALSVGKRSLHRMQELTADETMAFAQAQIEQLARSPEAQEGLAAFAARRAPAWRLTEAERP